MSAHKEEDEILPARRTPANEVKKIHAADNKVSFILNNNNIQIKVISCDYSLQLYTFLKNLNIFSDDGDINPLLFLTMVKNT